MLCFLEWLEDNKSPVTKDYFINRMLPENQGFEREPERAYNDLKEFIKKVPPEDWVYEAFSWKFDTLERNLGFRVPSMVNLDTKWKNVVHEAKKDNTKVIFQKINEPQRLQIKFDN